MNVLRSMSATALGLSIALSMACAGESDDGPPPPPDSTAQAAPLNATVLGSEVRASDADELRAAVLTPLFDAYAADQGIVADDAEVEAWAQNLRRAEAADSSDGGGRDDLTEEEAGEVAAMEQEMGSSLIRQWKVNRALYQEHGGRVVYQQFGPEPLDAYRAFLEQRQQAGDLSFDDPASEAAFWGYFRDDSMHDFMAPGGDDEARAFATPPWQEQA